MRMIRIDWRSYSRKILAYLYYDDRAFLIARQLVAKLGKDDALLESRIRAAQAKGGRATEWKQIARAVRDIAAPENLYHL